MKPQNIIITIFDEGFNNIANRSTQCTEEQAIIWALKQPNAKYYSLNCKEEKINIEKQPLHSHVAIHESKDGSWSVASMPCPEIVAKRHLGGYCIGETAKVVTLAEAKAHRKIIGAPYLYLPSAKDYQHLRG